jgi:hypothetical protein
MESLAQIIKSAARSMPSEAKEKRERTLLKAPAENWAKVQKLLRGHR